MKNKNKGGSGLPHSTQDYFIKGNNRKRFIDKALEGIVLTPEEVAEYLSGTHEIECLECGRWFRSLGSHLFQKHVLTKDDYCIKHGIPVGTALVCRDTHTKQSIPALARAKDEWEAGIRTRAMEIGHLNHKNLVNTFVAVKCVKCGAEYKDRSYVLSRPELLLCPDCERQKRRESARKSSNRIIESVTYSCHYCGENFHPTATQVSKSRDPSYRAHCSTKCAGLSGNALQKEKWAKEMIKLCATCGQEFRAAKRKIRFCSRPCQHNDPANLERLKTIGKIGALTRKLTAQRDSQGKFKGGS